jgi:hypothetical protein
LLQGGFPRAIAEARLAAVVLEIRVERRGAGILPTPQCWCAIATDLLLFAAIRALTSRFDATRIF